MVAEPTSLEELFLFSFIRRSAATIINYDTVNLQLANYLRTQTRHVILFTSMHGRCQGCYAQIGSRFQHAYIYKK